MVHWDNVAAAAELFAVSVDQGGCAEEGLSVKTFVEERMCDVRYSHALLLNDYVARSLRQRDAVSAALHKLTAQRLLHRMLQSPRFRGRCCSHWREPLDFNFN